MTETVSYDYIEQLAAMHGLDRQAVLDLSHDMLSTEELVEMLEVGLSIPVDIELLLPALGEVER